MRIVPPSGPLYDTWHTRGLGASSSEIVWKSKSRFSDEVALWSYITKRTEKDPISEAGQNGLDREPEIAALWEKETRQIGESVNIIDDEFDFFRAQIDWLAWDGTCAVDFKWSNNGNTYKKAGGVALLMGGQLSKGDGLDYWWYAAQHQLMILGHGAISYYCHNGNPHPIHLLIKRDEEHIKAYREKAWKWWTSYVVMDLPPLKNKKVRLVRDAISAKTG